MTIYLKFDTQEQAIASLSEAGYTLSEYNDTFGSMDGGWGTLFQIPNPDAIDENGEPIDGIPAVYDGWFVNIYDCDACPASLSAYQVADPETPYNVRA